ncbi:hypothetical protein [Streptomyces phaeochromogenes]
MPERASRIRQLVDLNDTEAAARRPERSQQDADFEARYAEEVVRQHGWLTIVGVDFPNAPDRWLLEDTYLSLEAEESTGDGSGGGQRTVLLADRAPEGWVVRTLLNAEPTDPDMSWLSLFPNLRVLRVNPRLPRVRNVPEGVTITA